MFKRFLCAVLATLFLALALPFAVQAKGAEAPELKSESAIVYSLNSGDVIFSKNAEESRAPASLTKITTTMTVLSMCDDPDNTRITVPDAGLFDEITAVGGSNIELQVGETLTVTELLYAVMLPSACDACNVLAYHFGNGSISAFVSEMNRWALEAGATQTNFQNAHGLDAPGHVSSAADTAKIILKAMENERFVEIINSLEYIIPENALHAKRYVNYQTTIPMLYEYYAEYYRGLVGIKSGYTLEAKCCLSTMAERDGERFLVVTLGAERGDGVNHARTDAAALYDWLFENFETKTLETANTALKTVEVSDAMSDTADLVLHEDLVVCYNKNLGEPTLRYDVKKPLAPPFDEEAGTLEVVQDDTVLSCVPLYFETVPVAAPLPDAPVTDGENDLSSSPLPTLGIVVVIIVLLVFFLGFCLVLLTRPPKKRRPAPRKNGVHPAQRNALPSQRRPQPPTTPTRRPPQGGGRRQG